MQIKYSIFIICCHYICICYRHLAHFKKWYCSWNSSISIFLFFYFTGRNPCHNNLLDILIAQIDSITVFYSYIRYYWYFSYFVSTWRHCYPKGSMFTCFYYVYPFAWVPTFTPSIYTEHHIVHALLFYFLFTSNFILPFVLGVCWNVLLYTPAPLKPDNFYRYLPE